MMLQAYTNLTAHSAFSRIQPALAKVSRKLYGSSPIRLTLEGGRLDLLFQPVDLGQADIEFTLRLSGHTFALQVTQPGALFPAVRDALTGSVPAEVRRAAVAYAIRSLWAAFEKWFDSDFDLLDISLPIKTRTIQEGVGLRISGSTEDGSGECTAVLCAMDQPGWVLLEGIPCVSALAVREMTDSLPLALRVFTEKQNAPWSDVRALEVGDVVVLDGNGHDEQRFRELGGRLLLGRHEIPHVTVQCAERRVTVTQIAALKPPHLSSRQRNSPIPMSTSETSPPSEKSPRSMVNENLSALDSVCVDLEFELGAVKVPLAAVQALAVGQVFELAQGIDSSEIGVWCGGHRLGSGQLIAVGDRLGVRIAELRGPRFAKEAAEEAENSANSSASGNAIPTDSEIAP